MVKKIILFALFWCNTLQAESWYLGQWRVIDVLVTGDSVLNLDDAQHWISRKATLRSDKAFFRTWQCEKPRYSQVTLSEKQFYADYRVSFEMLEIKSNRVSILDIQCPLDSSAKAALLIQGEENEPFSYSFWDGLFFKMSKI